MKKIKKIPKKTCYRQQINKDAEFFIFSKSVEIVEFFSNPDNIKKKQFMCKADIKRTVRGLLELVTNRKITITRDLDLLIENYRYSNNLSPKITTTELMRK